MKSTGTRSFGAMAGILSAAMLCVSVAWADEPAAPETSPPLIEPTPESSSGSETGVVQERGVIHVVPSLKPADALGQRPTTAPDNRYVAPTQNLTLVANALRLNHKSLTTLVTIQQGLPVTQPVEISIGYYSPAGNNRITQSYVAGAGNRFLYNDREGDGKMRRIRLDVSLMEPKPGGQPATFSFSWQVDLDPLYDVTISPLNFSLIDNCDITGNSEIRFVWWAPDDLPQNPHTFNFTTRVGRSTTISQIAWARAELSTQTNLRQLSFYFWEKDTIHPSSGFRAPERPSLNNLVPGKTGVVKGNLTDVASSNKQDCRAYFEYTITYALRTYPYL